jgi:hypothetical protein
MTESRGAGPLDRLLMGASALAVENNGIPYSALINLVNFVGVTITYHAPGEGEAYGSLDVELSASGTIAWASVTGKPTTVSASGLSDAVETSRTLSCSTPLRIDGGASANLSENRMLTILPASPYDNGYMSKEDFSKLANYPEYPDTAFPQWNASGGMHYPEVIAYSTGIRMDWSAGSVTIINTLPAPDWSVTGLGFIQPTAVVSGAYILLTDAGGGAVQIALSYDPTAELSVSLITGTVYVHKFHRETTVPFGTTTNISITETTWRGDATKLPGDNPGAVTASITVRVIGHDQTTGDALDYTYRGTLQFVRANGVWSASVAFAKNAALSV